MLRDRDSLNIVLGSTIRLFRKREGIDIAALTDKLVDITASEIISIEAGEIQVTEEIFEQICAALNVSKVTLLSEAERRDPSIGVLRAIEEAREQIGKTQAAKSDDDGIIRIGQIIAQ